MIKIVNLFKAVGVWFGTIFLLYGTQSVDKTVAQSYIGRGSLAVSRSEDIGMPGHSRVYEGMSPSTGFGGDPADYLRGASGQRFSTGGTPSPTDLSFSVGQSRGI